MPIYSYECKLCKHITEKFHRMDSIPKKARCETKGCGRMAHRIISNVALQCDSVNDVKWLNSARQALQPDAELREKPIETRTQYNKYLKDHHLACKG